MTCSIDFSFIIIHKKTFFPFLMEVWKAWNRQFSTSNSTQISLYLQIVKISRSMMGVFVCVSGSFVVKGKDICGFF